MENPACIPLPCEILRGKKSCRENSGPLLYRKQNLAKSATCDPEGGKSGHVRMNRQTYGREEEEEDRSMVAGRGQN